MSNAILSPDATRPAPADAQAQNGTRLNSLTGLRALAALGVFLAHLNVFLPVPGTHGWFGLGGAGVPYFFVLSGFVIAWSFSDRDTARRFYGRRFARIWPLMLAATVAGVALALWFAKGSDTDETLLLGTASVLLVHAWNRNGLLTSPDPVSWPVSVEAAFYLLFPAVVRPMLRRSLRQLAVLAVLFVLVGWGIKTYLWLNWPVGTRLDTTGLNAMVLGTMSPPARVNEFLLGVAAAAAMRKGWRSPVRPWVPVTLLVVALGVLMHYQNAPWRTITLYDALDPVCAPIFALLIVSVATRELAGVRSVLGSRPVVALGNWSYAFFLFHYLVLYVVGSLALHRHSLNDFFYQQVPATWANLGWAGLALVISVALAGALHLLYEQPLERGLRALFGARRGTRAATVPGTSTPRETQ
ncbi:acyltransferase family protein [Kitasatospora viridis]|uniref:Peptidoglycan/LPS O-acetylase OafA/YrhL n=1 Tax=Kitasatospora viridis TaxID=281105 RepID=A0A561UCE8_9ACTN|nr:acyltransferase [Kitasatospora viridis]TWF97042.1 peptidoglycan/LPS O-acetylase OafA/YrhL [Kitasatospora viridis]